MTVSANDADTVSAGCAHMIVMRLAGEIATISDIGVAHDTGTDVGAVPGVIVSARIGCRFIEVTINCCTATTSFGEGGIGIS